MGNFVLAGVVLTGAWTQLDTVGWPVWLLPIVIYLLDSERFRLDRWFVRRPLRPSSATAIVIAGLLCAIHLLHAALTAREEFGLGGDEGYHLSATRAFAIYMTQAGPYLAGAIALFVACRYRAPRLAATVAAVALIGSSFLLPPAALFGRYPTAFYLLSTPLNVAFDVARIPYPFTANHLINMLSVPAWLFALRPMILGRWPDWRVLPVALLIYFQGPSIVYASGGLLEPWAFVFVLLAMEAVVILEPERQWLAVFLAATATFFKETAILFVPPIWLLAMVEWDGWRPVLRKHALAAGVAAIAPFVTYYAVRRGLQIVRGYDVAGSGELWGVGRFWEMGVTAQYQLGIGGSIAVAVATAWCALGWVADRRWREHLVWSLTAVGLVIFFAADVASMPHTGYGRFLAYPLLAVCGLVFLTTHALAQRRPSHLAALSFALMALLTPYTTQILALDFRPDYERNSLEWSRSLVRLPIRSLSDRLPDMAGGGAVSKIRVVSFDLDLISLRVAYPDLATRFELQGDPQSPAAPDCRCRMASEALLAGFEWPAHFANTRAAHDRYQQQQSGCVAQVRATCAAVALEQRPDGAIVGVLGVGARPTAPTP